LTGRGHDVGANERSIYERNRARRIEEGAQKDMKRKIAKTMREIGGKSISFTLTPSRTTMEFMRLLESLGLAIKVVCVNTDWWTRWGFSENAIRQVAEAFQTELGGLRSNPHIYVNLDANEEMEKIGEGGVDLAFVEVLTSDPSRVMLYERNGVKALSPRMMHYSPLRVTYSQIARLGTVIDDKLKSLLLPRDLLYLDQSYHGRASLIGPSDLDEEVFWKEIAQSAWRDKNGRC
jgi:hypothetical protein